MNTRDLHDNVKISVGLEPQTIDSDTTTDGEIIDTQGFESLEFALQTGALADGAFACSLFESNANDMAGATLVTALFGSAPSFSDTESNTVKKVGFKGTKRYVRARVTSTSTTDGGIVGALAVQGAARNAPVA